MKNNDHLRTILFSLLAIVAAITFFVFPRVTTPIIISYILMLILNPVLVVIERTGVSRTVSAAAVVIILLFFTIYPIVKMSPVIISEFKNIEIYLPKIESYLRSSFVELNVYVKAKVGYEISGDYLLQFIEYFKSQIRMIIVALPHFLGSALEFLFIVPLFLFFTLRDMRSLKKKVARLLPNKYFAKMYYLSSQFSKQIGDYIMAKVIEASILGVIIFAGLFGLDIRFSILLGLLAAITNIVPYLGPFFGAIPALIFIAAEYGIGTSFGGALILYLVANIIDIVIVFPLLVSKIVDLHPVVVVASVILGSQLLGITGMIISIPMAAIIKLLIQQFSKDVYERGY